MINVDYIIIFFHLFLSFACVFETFTTRRAAKIESQRTRRKFEQETGVENPRGGAAHG